MASESAKIGSLEVVPVPAIQQRILVVRERQVMLDEDLARLYGVETRSLVQQVTRNRERFPPDFMWLSGGPYQVAESVNTDFKLVVHGRSGHPRADEIGDPCGVAC